MLLSSHQRARAALQVLEGRRHWHFITAKLLAILIPYAETRLRIALLCSTRSLAHQLYLIYLISHQLISFRTQQAMLILDSMANLKKRLAGAVLLTVLSMVSICLLLPNSRVSTHLQHITLGTTIDNYSGLWSWHEDESSGEEDVGGGIRLVVFGDSWVDDTVEENQEAKGKSWPEVMCEEVCIFLLNPISGQRLIVTDKLHISPHLRRNSTLIRMALPPTNRSQNLQHNPRLGRRKHALPPARRHRLHPPRPLYPNPSLPLPPTSHPSSKGNHLRPLLRFLGYLRLRTSRLRNGDERHRQIHRRDLHPTRHPLQPLRHKLIPGGGKRHHPAEIQSHHPASLRSNSHSWMENSPSTTTLPKQRCRTAKERRVSDRTLESDDGEYNGLLDQQPLRSRIQFHPRTSTRRRSHPPPTIRTLPTP